MSICVGCGICCDGTLFRKAALRPEEVAPMEQRGIRIQRRSSGELAFSQPCTALRDASCTVYDERPSACRLYRCDVLRRHEDGDLSEDDALALIAVTLDLRDRVMPAVTPFLDHDERRTMEDVYRSLLRKFEPSSTLARRVTPDPAAPTDAEVCDELPLRDLAIRVPSVSEPDTFGSTPFDEPTMALHLSQERLDELLATTGRDEPDVLATRDCIATWTGLSGRPIEALELHRALLSDRERVLGADHPDTLASRHEVADWTGVGGEPGDALRLHRHLLPDRTRVLGADHPNTLNTRHSIAYWTGVSGDAGGALAIYTDLLADRVRVLGADHPDTLSTRAAVAHWTGTSGDHEEALSLSGDLLFDRIRLLGASHPDAGASGRAVAYWTRAGGPAT